MMPIISLQREQEASLEEQLEITRFLNREAQLLDDRRYRDWLELLTEDVNYRAPLRFFRQQEGFSDDWAIEKELSPESDLQMAATGYAELKLRVERLLSGKAHTENPPWFTQRLITNIDIRRISTTDSYEVSSKFLLNRYKKGREQTIVGSRHDKLVRIDGQLRLQARRILYNADNYRWGSYVLI